MLDQMQTALLNHFTELLKSVIPNITTDKVFLTPVDDPVSHRLQLEENLTQAGVTGAPRFPYACLMRGDTLETHTLARARRKQRLARDVIVHRTDGTATSVDVAPMELEYRLRVYDGSLVPLDELYRLWMLSTFDDEEFYYEVSGIEEKIPVSLAFESPSGIYPTRDERRELGAIFYQDYPITIQTMLISDLRDAKLILTARHRYYTQEVPPDIESELLEEGAPVVAPIVNPNP